MAGKLLIVESPGKLKTLRKILGRDWLLEASVGHTTELASDGYKKLGFDVADGKVETRYIPRGSRGRKVLSQLRKAVSKVDEVYLATDPDREGEAIAWHLVEQLKLRRFYRVTYTQITETAVRNAIRNPQSLNLDLVASQRARQCLDKWVGFEVSPLLWRSTGGKSAGRVQSATLHLVCERERERLNFRPEDYWVLRSSYGEGFEALYEPQADPVPNGSETAKGEVLRVRTEDEARRIERIARTNPHVVDAVDRKEESRNPPPPFITSSLQQAAGMRFRYPPKKTMQIAQKLYEGVGGKGLITYMRTDAVTLSPEFVSEARSWIGENAPEALPARPPSFRVKADAQAAHEAIRPTSARLTPGEAARILDKDQLNLYTMIWERAIASQCKAARLSKTRISVGCAGTRWVARGSVVVEPGYLRFWKNLDGDHELPSVRPGQELTFRDVEVEKKTTQPPSRYSEPKLVQLMEKMGIGRPSTYASTIATLKDRDYVVTENRLIAPTELGMRTDEALSRALPDLVDTEFTARMEASLDRIAEGRLSWERYLCEWGTGYLQPALVRAKEVLGEFSNEAQPRAAAGGFKAGRKRKTRSRGGAESRSSGRSRRARGKGAVKAERRARGSDSAGLAEALERARSAGALPLCREGHGELELKRSRKDILYWKCPHAGCESFAFYQDYSDEACPDCGRKMAKVPSAKVTGGHFLKCPGNDEHAVDVVQFLSERSGQWERPRGRSADKLR